MPNHVTNRIIASPEVIDAITRHYTPEEAAEAIAENAQTAVNYQKRTGNPWPYAESDAAKLEERFVDFAMVVPEPENIFRGGCDMKHPHVVDGVTYEHCWSDWNRLNWGTKWNGYDTKIEAIEGDLCKLEFDSAWSHPEPVIFALAEKFPDEEIKVWFADEDMGSNVGYYTILAGDKRDESLFHNLEGTDEGFELACQLKRGQTAAEVLAERLEEDIDWARREVLAARVAKERNIELGDAFTAIREESIEIPDDIVKQIQTREDVDTHEASQTQE